MSPTDMKAPTQATVDARYAAKIAARKNGTTPIMVTAPELPPENPSDPAVVDARYRAKLAGHQKAAEAVAAAPTAAAAPAAPEAAPVEATEPVGAKESKSEGSFSQRQRR